MNCPVCGAVTDEEFEPSNGIQVDHCPRCGEMFPKVVPP